MITTAWSVAAVLVLSGCVVLGVEGALDTQRRRDGSAVAATLAVAAIVLTDGWGTALTTAGAVLFLVAVLRAVTRWSDRRHQAAGD